MSTTSDPEPAEPPRRRAGDRDLPPAWLHEVREACRARARRKSTWAKRINVLRNQGRGMPHEEVRARLSQEAGRPVTPDEYRRYRRWLADAMADAMASEGLVSFEEALVLHEDRQVDLVSRYALLKRAGANRDQIRRHLNLSHDGVDATAEWLRDAEAAVRRARQQAA